MSSSSRILGILRRARSAVVLATERFPAASVLMLAAAVVVNLKIEDVDVVDDAENLRLVGAFVAAAAASVGARLVAEGRGVSGLLAHGVQIAAAALVGLCVWFAVPLGVYAPALGVAAALFIPLAPYVWRPDDRRFWTFALWGSVGSGLAFLSVILFVAGVSAILEMVRYLFGIGLHHSAYEHVWATAFVLVGPLFALGRLPADLDESIEIDHGDRLTAGVRFLFEWVAVPLALVTAAILHLYVAKILTTGEVPRGQIGWIVGFFSFLVLSARIASDPFLHEGSPVPARIFRKAWAAVLVIPLVLLGYAVLLRVSAEGFTVERYYLAIAFLASATVVLVQAVPAWRGSIRTMAAVPLLMLAVSSFGPWGVHSTVGRSQSGRLGEILSRNAGAAPSEEARSEMRSRLHAMHEVDALSYAVPLLDPKKRERLEAGLVVGNERLERTLTAFGVQYDPNRTVDVTTFSAQSQSYDLDATGFDLVVFDRDASPNLPEPVAPVAETVLRIDGSRLVVRLETAKDSFDLAPFLASIPAERLTSDGSISGRPVTTDLTSEAGRTIRISLTHARLGQGSRRPSGLVATVLLRKGEWTLP